MLLCSFCNLSRLRQKRKPKYRNATTIEVRSSAPEDSETWRLAVLSSDAHNEDNLVSQRLVTNVLHLPIQPLDKEAAASVKAKAGKHRAVEGYVDLVWCFQTPPRDKNKTKFLVSKTFNPPYDAVLGRKDSITYGMMEEKRTKHG
ncbi:hypothetical protein EJ04DRAFT_565619 [Polyplosphaeria fusca]|uniref:Uncharacterized protein n=1 Tax=Polyplosphaeria fusca TaxID=682080 RepID=A0A9P4QXU5_9PLEO|nr:hypothetical protein EJ04DRAFT_565619 [Polyplosphaeria fusca]